MDLNFIRDQAGFDALALPWNQLLARSASDVPFLRHEYLHAWWSTLGGGEWDDGSLWVGAARGQDGALLGLAPLFQTRTKDGRPGLMLLGSIEISDYLDLLVPADAAGAFATALLGALDSDGPQGWEVLDLYNLPEGSPSLTALEAAARARGWQVSGERLQPCPVISLQGDWDTYLASLDKKQRHELRRKLRRADGHVEPVSWRIIGPDEDIRAAVGTLLDLMSHDPHKAGFLSPAMRQQFDRSLRAAQENGWLQLALLHVGGAPAAGYLNFDYGNRIWVYNSGLHPDYLELSLGWVLLGHLIRWAIEHGRREFDFLRGEEDYKSRLGGIPRYVHRLVIERNTVA